MNVIGRCIPDITKSVNLPSYMDDFIDYSENFFTTVVGDVSHCWWVLLCSAGISIFVAFLSICFFQCCGFCIVWISIILCIILLLGAGVFVLYTGIVQLDSSLDSDHTSAYVFIGFGSFILLFDLLLLLVIIGLCRRISLATRLIQESSKAIRSMCCIIFVPVIYTILEIIAVVLLVVVMVYYFSIDVSVDYEGSRSVNINTTSTIVALLTLFFFFWITAFLIGMNRSTIAGAGAEWYFERDKDNITYFPIARALKILLLHHLGSVAVGSFMIALVALFRSLVLYLSKKYKEIMNPTLKTVLCCCGCCLKCLQKVVEFISSRAYIMMMIFGKSFFPSAIDALNLMLRNILRTSLLSGISGLVIFFCTVACSAITTFCCIIIIRPDFLGVEIEIVEVVNWWLFSLLCFIISFAVVYIIMQVYDSLIDTIFLCFLVDEEIAQNKGVEYNTYCSTELGTYMENIKIKGEQAKKDREEEERKYNENRKRQSIMKKEEELMKEKSELEDMHYNAAHVPEY